MKYLVNLHNSKKAGEKVVKSATNKLKHQDLHSTGDGTHRTTSAYSDDYQKNEKKLLIELMKCKTHPDQTCKIDKHCKHRTVSPEQI